MLDQRHRRLHRTKFANARTTANKSSEKHIDLSSTLSFHENHLQQRNEKRENSNCPLRKHVVQIIGCQMDCRLFSCFSDSNPISEYLRIHATIMMNMQSKWKSSTFVRSQYAIGAMTFHGNEDIYSWTEFPLVPIRWNSDRKWSRNDHTKWEFRCGKLQLWKDDWHCTLLISRTHQSGLINILFCIRSRNSVTEKIA